MTSDNEIMNMTKPQILVYRHDDPDGLWSAAIINYLKDDIIDVPVNYNKNTWNKEDVDNAEWVYVLDFTFDDMPKLIEYAGNKLVWIDHHKTAMERFTDQWNDPNIAGIRSLDNSGCGLTWKYIFRNRTAPDAIKYIEDRDLWNFKYPETKAFCESTYLTIKDVNNPDIYIMLEEDYTCVNKYLELGNTLLEAKQKRIEASFDRGYDVTLWGYNARIVNAITDISDIGSYIYSKPEYDIAIMWFVDNDTIKYSLRSNTVDVSEIARKYGGGGHSGAAGFNIRITDLLEHECDITWLNILENYK